MKYILTQQNGFKEKYLSTLEYLGNYSPEKIVALYNKEVLKGIVGVYEQGVYLVALRLILVRTFNQSPILIEENTIISLTDEVKIYESKLYYLNDQILRFEDDIGSNN